MVEGLTTFSTDQESALIRDHPGNSAKSKFFNPSLRARSDRSESTLARRTQCTQEILVTLAERPHPFPSRTRSLSSPAPKILRGQPFGKIGRRQDFCVPAARFPHGTAVRETHLYACASPARCSHGILGVHDGPSR